MRRRYRGAEFAGRDLWLVVVFVALLLGIAEVEFLYAAAAYAAAVATYLLVRWLERRRAEKANTAPYWTEKLKDD